MTDSAAAALLLLIGIGRPDAAAVQPDPLAALRSAIERGAATPARPPMPVPLLTLKPAPAPTCIAGRRPRWRPTRRSAEVPDAATDGAAISSSAA